MNIEPDARVCRCEHTAHWHGARQGEKKVPMGEGACDSCDCPAMDEVRTDSLSSLRYSLVSANERVVALTEALLTARLDIIGVNSASSDGTRGKVAVRAIQSIDAALA